jgi:hypothetical protein
MKPFEIEETQGKKTAWIYPEERGEYEPASGEPEAGRVALKVAYFTPAEKEALFHRMVSRGVMKRKIKAGAERFDIVPGRRLERDTMFAEALVLDWRGVRAGGQDLAYSAPEMAKVLAGRQDIYDSVWAAVDDIGLFFGVSGGGSSGG